ncbi:unnamed protein product, partial [Protopolystoma xenopodis]
MSRVQQSLFRLPLPVTLVGPSQLTDALSAGLAVLQTLGAANSDGVSASSISAGSSAAIALTTERDGVETGGQFESRSRQEKRTRLLKHSSLVEHAAKMPTLRDVAEAAMLECLVDMLVDALKGGNSWSTMITSLSSAELDVAFDQLAGTGLAEGEGVGGGIVPSDKNTAPGSTEVSFSSVESANAAKGAEYKGTRKNSASIGKNVTRSPGERFAILIAQLMQLYQASFFLMIKEPSTL